MNNRKPLLKGGYPFTGVLIQGIALFFIGYLIEIDFMRLNKTVSVFITATVSFLGTFYLAYKNLYSVVIYDDLVKIKYLLWPKPDRDFILNYEDILAVYYKRTSGKGVSKLALIFMSADGKEKVVLFPGVSTAPTFVRILKNFMDKNVKVVIDPP